MRTGKTPYLDIFHAVYHFWILEFRVMAATGIDRGKLRKGLKKHHGKHIKSLMLLKQLFILIHCILFCKYDNMSLRDTIKLHKKQFLISASKYFGEIC